MQRNRVHAAMSTFQDIPSEVHIMMVAIALRMQACPQNAIRQT